jgi:predicted nucleic acid-binding protein
VSRLVIDAGVALKWVVPEEDSEQALALRRRVLVAPDLLIVECANVLWKLARRNEISEEEAGFAAALIAGAEIELVPMRHYIEAATRVAIALDHPAYDCFYIAMAEAEGLKVITTDSRMLRKARGGASGRYRERVLHLSETATLQED